MKKVLSALLAAGMVVAGCSIEDPFSLVTDPEESSSTSGVEGDTTLPVPDDSEDNIGSTSFDRTISIAFSESGNATVTGDDNGIVTVDGNGVTAKNTTSEKVKYVLSGSTGNGFFKLYSDKKQAIVLDGVSITNPNGAAINNQSKKRCFVVVNGTNTLADGSTYNTPANEDEKAAFFSEGQLIFSGDGTLNVNAAGKAGITSDDYLHFVSSTVNVTATAGHGLRGKDYILVDGGNISATVSAAMKKGMTSDSLVVFNGGNTVIKVSGGVAYDDEDKEYKASAGIKSDYDVLFNDGVLTITNSGQGGKGITCDHDAYFQGGSIDVRVTGNNYGTSSSGGWPGSGSSTTDDNSKSAKGIKIDGNIYISGGNLFVTAANHEAIEAKGKLEITGGTIYAQSKDDAINSGDNMAITGGYVCAYSTGNDGLDANGNLYIEGGLVYCICSGNPEVAIDANTEGGKKLYVNDGVLFTLGGLERGSALNQTCYSASSWNKNTWYSMTVGDVTYCFKTPSSGGSGLVVSAASQPTVKSGITPEGGTQAFNGMAVFDGNASGGTQVSLSTYTSGNSGGGPGGGGPGGGGRW